MYSFNFPDMLGENNTKLMKDKEALGKLLVLTLNTERRTLFGDPGYGSGLIQALFEQNSNFVIDLLIDEIYTTIVTFLPYLYVKRENIKITTDKVNIYAEVYYTYVEDGTSDMFSIRLTSYDNT